jgi:N-acetylneuraminic acid mutarotase
MKIPKATSAILLFMLVVPVILTGCFEGAAFKITEEAQSFDGTLGTWTTAGSLFDIKRYHHASVVYNGYLYVIGGSAGSNYFDDVQYAPINADGDLESWIPASYSFTTPREAHASVVKNGYLYVIGGLYNDGSDHYLSDVQYAPINADGDPGMWAPASYSLTDLRGAHASVVDKGYLYVIGGHNGSTYYDDVQYVHIDPVNGDLGSWTTANFTFTTKRLGHTSVVHNGYLYVIGGYTNEGSVRSLNDVQYAPINADGSLGSWKAGSSFDKPRRAHASVVYKGYLYVIGGHDDINYFNDVQYAHIKANGSLGSWTTTSPFATERQGHAVVVYNSRLYVIGGYDGSNYHDDVQYAKFSR